MPILITDYTTGALDGTGAFDKMMVAAKAHVVYEYDQGRIKGPEYAVVYLGLLNQVMDKALTFLLEKDKIDLQNALIQAQIDKIAAEILLVEKEVLKVTEEILLINAQKCLAQAQFDLTMAQVPKVAAEIDLLNQKTVTELAQTNGAGIGVDSVLGKQNALYTKQTEGFTRNAEQAAAKALIETWSVRRTTDEGTAANATNKLQDDYVGQAVTKLLQGIGAAG